LAVRGTQHWLFHFSVDPSAELPEQLSLIEAFSEDLSSEVTVTVNDQREGVHRNPYLALDHCFKNSQFVVLTEEDFVVSEDVLEYFDQLSDDYQEDVCIATVSARGGDGSNDPSLYEITEGSKFNVWGTWVDRWRSVLEPTWDMNYSTFNGSPGVESGWDWNFSSRVFPSLGMRSVHPLASKSDHIGYHGIHSTPANFASTQASNFVVSREPRKYRCFQ
jgi:hypothetical protein